MNLFTAGTRGTVMTVRCMRKTLHTLPLPLAQAAHGATVHFRERDALRAITNADIKTGAVSRVTKAIVELLQQSGTMFHRDIEARLVGRHTTAMAVRLALKLAWEQGQFTYVNETTGWNREHRKFALTSVLYPQLDMAMDRRRATAELMHAYFDRYGPASMRDAMWWSGLSRSAITAAMAASGREWVAVQTPWADAPLYMHRQRFEEFQATNAAEWHTGLNFLAHEDVALKAYFETRQRYLGELHPRQAFNQIGEVLPTIVVDGQVVGTWAWDTTTKAIVCKAARGAASTDARVNIKKQSLTLSAALRQGWLASSPLRGDSAGNVQC